MKIQALLIGTAMFALSACGQKAEEETAAVATNASAESPPSAAPASLPRTALAVGASIYFVTPVDGAIVTNPVKIEFGAAGVEIVKAGNDRPGSGHHHLLIDTEIPDLGQPIPADEHHVHFGDGSTNTEITLAPGAHTLQMLLGDYLHIPHDPPLVSEPITVTVE